ncbi:TraB/VirB10 family protein [Kistimonas scapharcae]|uniref:TraB/VirB10 family protein n=1 Tax=Kistimonas scapharcae TaxID=1036133 RepID=A0ABP8V2M7_9GAMM
MDLRNIWENLSPKNRRIVVVGGLVFTLISIIVLASPDDGEKRSRKTDKERKIENILTDVDTRSLSIESIASQLRQEISRNDKLSAEVAHARKKAEDAESQLKGIDRLEKRLNALSGQIEKIEKNGVRTDTTAWKTNPEAEPPSMEEQQVHDEIFSIKKTPVDHAQRVVGRSDIEKTPLPSIRTIEEAKEETASVEQDDPDLYLPTGSMMSGYLITGLDAPTAKGARKEPFPVLVRIKKEAVLPNYNRINEVRECFMTMAGYGDLSSERAYLRGETMSCVKEDGEVMEAKVDSYATGEDGKAGLRGRLVSKQGQLLARSMMAGFAQGVSEAFDVNPVPVISTNTDGSQNYNKVMSSEAMQGAGVKGLSNSMERLADFYMELADQMHPVIEIGAGRRVEIIVTRGTTL